MMRIDSARDYFYHLHDIEVNQKYNKILPYSFHLDMVEKQVDKFIYLLNNNVHSIVYVATFGHDSIEDCRLTYNDIKDVFGYQVAEIIYLCTENKGRTRSERKSDDFYKELKTNELAVFVKLCDLVANVKFSFLSNSSMFNKYKQEYNTKIKIHLYNEKYKDIFNYLDKIFEI